ncbi:Membrane associated serine protease, rhomboid family [Haladaptatus litoreus]|uniref:Membrane associated serine protease, rhomboid family n=1 Tax=Haladaptatus litoreus TaxID=553468 RepID=A0A1N6VCI4_9EURY|nr:rhomboid family intramembrane serine protease [Haladaptatus litoreus]SIQ75610.1 Membrane associated serine protease, rhomboid family [Haladaptatus litoreus]
MRLSRSPTIQTLIVFCVVYALQSVIRLVSPALMVSLFALSPPVAVRPWTLPLSVYAHINFGHLLSNAIALLFAGLLIERVTTRFRFHAYFLTVGIVAGVAQIWIGGLFSMTTPAVLGASGAVFGLFGYLIAGNPVADAVLGKLRLSRRAQIAVVFGLALLATLMTASPGVALIAHFTGFAVGLIAGRLHILRVETQATSNDRAVQ